MESKNGQKSRLAYDHAKKRAGSWLDTVAYHAFVKGPSQLFHEKIRQKSFKKFLFK